MSEHDLGKYQCDKNGFYTLDHNGNKWRPIELVNGRIVADHPLRRSLQSKVPFAKDGGALWRESRPEYKISL